MGVGSENYRKRKTTGFENHLAADGAGAIQYVYTSSTRRNAMTFTAGFCDTAIDRQDVERFLDVFVRELPGQR